MRFDPAARINRNVMEEPAKVWRVGPGDCRIQTTNPGMIQKLSGLSRVRKLGYAMVGSRGGPLAIFGLDSRKMNSAAIGRILGANLTQEAIR